MERIRDRRRKCRHANQAVLLVVVIAPFFADPAHAFCSLRHGSMRRPSFLRLSDSSQGIGIGIDLGTTFSAVAILDDYGMPQIIPTTNGDRTIPSVVAIVEDSTVVGKAAVSVDNAYRHVKRIIGTGGKIDPAIAAVVPHIRISRQGKTYKKDSLTNQLHDAEHFPAKLHSTLDPTGTICPEYISSCILQTLKDQVEAHTGKIVTRAVIGVPAYFNDAQRQATLDAATLAGMDQVKLLREPEAAALAYGKMLAQNGPASDDVDNELVLVLDLGGGTYDVSILIVADGVTEILCTSGNVQLGGADMDRRIASYLLRLVKAQQSATETSKWSEQTMGCVMRAAEKVRIYLSNNKIANLALPLDELAWSARDSPSSIILPVTYKDGDANALPETGRTNSTHLLCQLSRKKMESLCHEELLALLRPLREVAIVGGALLPGDADPGVVQMSLELEEADKQEYSGFYADDDSSAPSTAEDELMRQMKHVKKAQQKGRRKAHNVAKNQKKFRAEKSRLRDSNQKVQSGIHGRPLSRVVLVGGTTRMPAIGKIIAAVTGVVPQRTVNPDEAVALGCAVHVGVLDGDERMGTVLNPMQAAIVRALAKQQGLFDGRYDEDDDDDSFEFDGEDLEYLSI